MGNLTDLARGAFRRLEQKCHATGMEFEFLHNCMQMLQKIYYFSPENGNIVRTTISISRMSHSVRCHLYAACNKWVVGSSRVFETRLKLGNIKCKSHFNRNEVILLMIDKIKTNQIVKFDRAIQDELRNYLNVFFVPLHHLFTMSSPKQ